MTSQNWTEDAVCARTDPEAFFPEKGGSNRTGKALCDTCPAKAPCLQWALDHNEQYGIFGGTSREDRQKMKREMGTAA
jgi:WhiB family redox-sensing transcriptional regulator